MKFISILIIFSIFFSTKLISNSDVEVVPVGKATLEKTYLFLDTDQCSCDDLIKIISDDINLYKKYFVIEKDKAASSIRVIIKRNIDEQLEKVDDTVEKVANNEGEASSSFDLELINKNATEPFYQKTIAIDESQSNRWVGHEIAGKIFSAVTKKEHIFHSKITFVSDKDVDGKKTKFKQIYISDFDGHNTKRITL